MKLLFLLFTLLSFACSGQVDTNAYIGVPVLKSKNISVKLYYPLVIEPTWEYENRKVIMTGQIYKGGKPYAVMSGETMITENLLLRYADECYADTLVLTKTPELPNDYIIEHPHYREALTEAQLKKKGYEYQYRFLESDSAEWKYYFVKIPTLAGFAEWLRTK